MVSTGATAGIRAFTAIGLLMPCRLPAEEAALANRKHC